MKNPIKVYSDQSERLNYNHVGLPVYARSSHLVTYNYESIRHWHPDIELAYIHTGSADYFVNGKIIHLHEGECIFVNSRRIHSIFSPEKVNCNFICAILSPAVFPEHISAVASYLHSKKCSSAVDYLVLRSNIPAENKVMETMENYFNCINDASSTPLEMLSLSYQLYAEICALIPDVVEENNKAHTQLSFINMTSFIHSHFAEQISLDDIAAAGAMCRSKCYQMFKQRLNQSPKNYLTQYRIAKSCELLKSNSISINEIALQCGFQNPSYFASVFRGITGQTPRKYRANNSQNE